MNLDLNGIQPDGRFARPAGCFCLRGVWLTRPRCTIFFRPCSAEVCMKSRPCLHEFRRMTDGRVSNACSLRAGRFCSVQFRSGREYNPRTLIRPPDTETSRTAMEIVLYPHPALRWKSKPVREINADLRRTVDEMFDLMYTAKGIGLAANQVGLPYRLFVLNLSAERDVKEEEIVFVNPEIIRRKGTTEGEEGCLSFPGMYGQVKRAAKITVESFNLKGECFEYALDDLAARAVQHETDHLDGVLFIDRLTENSRRELDPVVADFETQFRRWQSEGRYPPDEVIRQELERLESK
jgi:peptide deformylase